MGNSIYPNVETLVNNLYCNPESYCSLAATYDEQFYKDTIGNYLLEYISRDIEQKNIKHIMYFSSVITGKYRGINPQMRKILEGVYGVFTNKLIYRVNIADIPIDRRQCEIFLLISPLPKCINYHIIKLAYLTI